MKNFIPSRIAIICAVYPPEPVVSAQMGRDLAEQLACDGNKVTVLCPYPSRPLGALYKDIQLFSKAHSESENEVNVMRLRSFCSPQSRFISRMRESISFGRHACSYLARNIHDVDVVYANTWPLFSQALIARYCKRRGIPLVLHIQDVYPDSILLKLPKILSTFFGPPLTALDRWTASQSTAVITISENMRRTYVENRGISSDKVFTINNWQDDQYFTNLPSRSAGCEKYQIQRDLFTFVYLGNIGPVAGVGLLIKAFAEARLERSQLLIIGGGSAKRANEEIATRLRTPNIHFISDPDAKNVPLLQSMADVFLLPVKRGAGLSSVPSKLMSYMFSAKPILASVDADSDTARAILEAQCGWIEEPENITNLANKMREVAAFSSDRLHHLGQSGRIYGLDHYSMKVGVRKLSDVILSTIK